MRKLGISLFISPGLTAEDQIKLMSEAGFQASFTGMIDLKKLETFANLFAKYNIAYETIHAPFRPVNEIWLDCEIGEKVYQDFITCIDRCAMFDIPTMVLHMSSGLTPPPVTDLGRQRYENIIEYATKKGIVLAFENLRKLSHLAWVFETFADNDTVKLCWDCGHQQCYTPKIEFMPMFGEKLVSLHIHDNYGVLNQDDHLIPFDGVIDFEKVTEQIRRSGYQGSMMFELSGGTRAKYPDLTPEEFLHKAASAVKRLIEMTDGK